MRVKLLVLHIIVLLFFVSCASVGMRLTDEQWKSVKIRTINKPYLDVSLAVILVITENGYEIEWYRDDSKPLKLKYSINASRIDKRMVHFSGVGDFFQDVYLDLFVEITPINEYQSRIYMDLSDTTRSPMINKWIDIEPWNPQKYDRMYDKIGEKLGVDLPPRSPGKYSKELGQNIKVPKQYSSYFNLHTGVVILEVHHNSKAEKAGLKPGDLIIEYNGKWVHMDNSAPNNLAGFDYSQTTAEEMIEITIIRQGQKITFNPVFPIWNSETGFRGTMPGKSRPSYTRFRLILVAMRSRTACFGSKSTIFSIKTSIWTDLSPDFPRFRENYAVQHRNRLIRARISAKTSLETATSAIWKVV